MILFKGGRAPWQPPNPPKGTVLSEKKGSLLARDFIFILNQLLSLNFLSPFQPGLEVDSQLS